MPRTAQPERERWGHSTVRTACPLDCPDSCALDVTVENGRIQKIDGADDNPVTRNFICAKVRRFGEPRLATTICAAPTGAANQALYGKMPGVVYQDYVHAKLIVLWGVNPSASGIHLIPFIKEAQA